MACSGNFARTPPPQILTDMNRMLQPNLASAASCLLILLTGCNTYVLSTVHAPTPLPGPVAFQPSPSHPLSSPASPDEVLCPPSCDPRLNSLLLSAAAWFARHNYSFVTNEDSGEFGFSAYFSSSKLEHAAYHCVITTDQANEVLAFSASAPGALESIPGDLIPKLLIILNAKQNWGHYTLGPEERTLSFKIALFHPKEAGQELDRLLNEALNALDSAALWLSAFKQTDDEDEDNNHAPDLESGPRPGLRCERAKILPLFFRRGEGLTEGRLSHKSFENVGEFY